MNNPKQVSPVPQPPDPNFSFQVTKYNPADRNDHGAYIGAEDARSDHGPVEAAYLDAISAFAKDAGVTTLSIREPGVAGFVNFGVEPTVDGDGLLGLFPEGSDCFYDGAVVSLDVGRELVRAMLRDNGAWCRLEVDDRFAIHIGYDQYLYIGTTTSSERAIAAAHDLGLFVEPISRSPYSVWDPDDLMYPPADAEFWTDVAGLVTEHGSLLLEANAVRNQPRWHRLTPDYLNSVRASLLPRSVLQLRPDLSTNVTEVLKLLQDDLVQVVWEDQTGRIADRYVDPEFPALFKAEMASARSAAIMSIYADESVPLLSAVLPDSDGVVRARWTQ